jgi:hypothetical protein
VVPEISLHGISCPSTTLCASTDGADNVLTSTAPAKGASSWHFWTVNYGPTYTEFVGPLPALAGVQCPSTTLCLGFDQQGDFVSSTDPLSYDWTVDFGPGAWDSGPPSLVLAPNSLACPSASACVAVGGSGGIEFTKDPTAAAWSWAFRHVDGSKSITGISCPTATFCVAVDNYGDVMHGTATPAPSAP